MSEAVCNGFFGNTGFCSEGGEEEEDEEEADKKRRISGEDIL